MLLPSAKSPGWGMAVESGAERKAANDPPLSFEVKLPGIPGLSDILLELNEPHPPANIMDKCLDRT